MSNIQPILNNCELFQQLPKSMELQDKSIGIFQTVTTITVSGRAMILIEGIKTNGHLPEVHVNHLLLSAPSHGLCQQYREIIHRVIRMLYCSFVESECRLDVVRADGQGVFMYVSKVCEEYMNDVQHAQDKIAWKVLHIATSEPNSVLVENAKGMEQSGFSTKVPFESTVFKVFQVQKLLLCLEQLFRMDGVIKIP